MVPTIRRSHSRPNAEIEQTESAMEHSQSSLENAALTKLLKFDSRTWADCQERKNKNGFVQRKTQEFMNIMHQMGRLDHNSLASDRKSNIETKVDSMMKDIAISARKRYS